MEYRQQLYYVDAGYFHQTRMRNRVPNPTREKESLRALDDLCLNTLPHNADLIPSAAILELVRSLHPINQSEEALSQLLERLCTIIHDYDRPLRVGIFEGAFDPPHRGHEETARAAIGIGNLDLLVVNCYPSAHHWKPNLSPQPARLEMTASYFKEDAWTVVSPLPRTELERLLRKHITTGVIGSDTFNRFLSSGVPKDFNTNSILVTERRDSPLQSAPETLNGRPVIYVGASQLAFNGSSSTEIRANIHTTANQSAAPMLNEPTTRIAHALNLYSKPHSVFQSEEPPVEVAKRPNDPPYKYRSCFLSPRRGLMNGLLSESFLDEVKDPRGEVIAFRKTLPPHREPAQSLSDELLGLREFNALNLPKAHAPEALLAEQSLALWIERAPGETLASLLIGYERGERSLHDTCAGLQGIGATLRELHTGHRLPCTPNAYAILKKHFEEVNTLVSSAPAWRTKEPEYQRALQEFHAAGESLLKTGSLCSLVHGDANCGNFLWDADHQTVWAIDLQRFGTQLRIKESAFPSYEYHQLLSSLHYFPNFGFRGIQGRSDYLLDALREAYGELPPAEDAFFRSRWTLQRLLGRHERVKPPSPGDTSPAPMNSHFG